MLGFTDININVRETHFFYHEMMQEKSLISESYSENSNSLLRP